jgi:DNA-directed RNA polymerase specialized sigma24 family protein
VVHARDLVERAHTGNHDAYTALAGTMMGRLEAAAMLILRDPDRADEAVQETMIRCWRDLPTLRDPSRFEAWLHCFWRLRDRFALLRGRDARSRPLAQLRRTGAHEPAVAGHSMNASGYAGEDSGG